MGMVTEPQPVGMDAAALAAVERLVHTQITADRWHPGAALAGYRHGRLVLDVVAGLADTQRVEPVQPDTLFQLRSAGKPFASVALLQLIERGKAGLDEPVAAAWPAFGQHDKGRVTLRHILTHRGGFADIPVSIPWQRWGAWDAVVRAMEALPLVFEPGTASAYHHLTQQWVCAELVRRLDGRPFPVYLREEVTGPLGMHDTYVGLPAALAGRVAKVHATEGVEELSIRTLNRIEVQQAPAPVFGVATARDMARFYAALTAGGSLDGVRILRS
jgi:CubicO group peptidase (beta-lactamase class C family)